MKKSSAAAIQRTAEGIHADDVHQLLDVLDPVLLVIEGGRHMLAQHLGEGLLPLLALEPLQEAGDRPRLRHAPLPPSSPPAALSKRQSVSVHAT